ncbi:MAG TPA: VTT domain-containing protein, partial [Nitrospira sp.]|nr:VTT domain-containing protein [Nitrospira sp.]HNK50542.1 VTT domain-containing protein [Nitrospira sp.]
SRRMAERGLWAVLLVRILPIAPFSVINLIAGASSVSWRHFVLGTVVGMLPGIAIMATFVSGLEEAVREPSWQAFSMVGLVVAAAWAGVWYVSSRLQSRQSTESVMAAGSSVPAT